MITPKTAKWFELRTMNNEQKTMKQLTVLAGCCVILSALAGCQNSSAKLSNQSKGAYFPKSMVGVWEAKVSQYSKWGFKFEPDGSISKIIHPVAGPVRLAEGCAYGGETEDSYYFFIMGPCEAYYNHVTRMLKVKITVENYMFKLPAGKLEGKMEDYLEGPVSNDGKKWQVSWRNYCWLEGADPPDANLIEANPEKLVFTKIDIDKLRRTNQ